MAKIIKKEEFIRGVEQSNGIKVVDFFATWCGPCKMLSPVFEGLAGQMKGSADFYKVDIDESLELARQYEVTTVPTVIVFKDGKPVNRLVGFIPAPKLEEAIKAHI